MTRKPETGAQKYNPPPFQGLVFRVRVIARRVVCDQKVRDGNHAATEDKSTQSKQEEKHTQWIYVMRRRMLWVHGIGKKDRKEKQIRGLNCIALKATTVPFLPKTH